MQENERLQCFPSLVTPEGPGQAQKPLHLPQSTAGAAAGPGLQPLCRAAAHPSAESRKREGCAEVNTVVLPAGQRAGALAAAGQPENSAQRRALEAEGNFPIAPQAK